MELTIVKKVSFLMDSDGDLSDWEYDFVQSVAELDEEQFTDKQIETVEEIWHRIFG